jgi:hypothetical protein
MAKKAKRITDPEQNEARTDVTWRNVGLISAFAVLLVVSIFTVMIPELTDDGAEEEADAAGSVSEETPPASDVPATSASPHSP